MEAASLESWRDEGLQGLELCFAREGFMSLALEELTGDRLYRARFLISAAPAKPFSEDERKTIVNWVKKGGVFICTAGYDCAAASQQLLAEFGLYVGCHPGERAPEPLGWFKSPYLDLGAYKPFVRFWAAWPLVSKQMQGQPEPDTVALGGNNQPVILVRRILDSTGQDNGGRVVLVGDTNFAMNLNLERESGEAFEGMRENSDFWHWFIESLTDVDPPCDPRGPRNTTDGAQPHRKRGNAMKRAFFAIALLAVSWLPAIGYFHHPDGLTCAVLIAAGVLMLIGASTWELDRGVMSVAAILSAIAIIWIPWPYRAIPMLLACGLALHVFPIPVRWPHAVGAACISASLILLAQAIALFAYTQITARSHELPEDLAGGIVRLARLIGIDAAYDGNNISLATMRVNHPMAATWELLIDPATVCFLVGGLLWIGRRNWRGELIFIACILAWLPTRIALLLGLFMHRAIRTDYDAPILLMNQFWSTWTTLLMLAIPAFLATPWSPETPSPRRPRAQRRAASASRWPPSSPSPPPCSWWLPSATTPSAPAKKAA